MIEINKKIVNNTQPTIDISVDPTKLDETGLGIILN